MTAPTIPIRGRSEDIARIVRLVVDPSVRLVTLTGRGGVGKTTLAHEVARRLRRQNSSVPVVFVRLEGVTDPGDVIDQIAHDLGGAINVDSTVEGIARYLTIGPSVLVVDNFEHVIGASPELTELIERCPDLTVLVTSRTPLRLRSEVVVQVWPLANKVASSTESTDVAAIGALPAVEVYCDRAGAVDDRFELGPHNAGTISQLCERLDGLPLAIELAAARAATLPAHTLLRLLDEEPLDALASGYRDAPLRHRNLRASLTWSVDLLTPTHRRLFARLSVVTGAFGLDTVEALGAESDDAMDDLVALVDVHLVEPMQGDAASNPVPDTGFNAGEPTFTMLPTTRAFAAEQLVAIGEHASVERRHIDHVASWVQLAARDLEASGRVDPGFAMRRADLVQCLRRAIELGEVDATLGLVLGLAPYWHATGYSESSEGLIESALKLADSLDSQTGSFAAALAWSVLLHASHRSTVPAPGHPARLDQALALARAVGDDEAVLRVHAARLMRNQTLGDVAAARAAAHEGLDHATAIGEPRWVAAFEVWAGMLAHFTGDVDRALELGLRGLAGAREAGDVRTIAVATMLLGPLVMRHPEHADEVPPTREVVELAREAGQMAVVSLLLPYAADEMIRAGELDAAATYLADAFSMCWSSGPDRATFFLAGFTLVVSQMFFASFGRDDLVITISHGLRPHLPSLTPWLIPSMTDQLAKIHDESAARLEPVAAERAAAAGSALTFDSVVEFVRQALAEHMQATADTAETAEAATPSLTARQTEVVRLMASGLTNREIAAQLHLAPKTIMHHLTAAYRAMGVRRRSEATVWAVRNGIVS